jgi:ABC-2 type transport system ATP-binding protein
VILDGEIVATGSPAELKRRVGGEILEVNLADEDGERAAEIARAADLFEPEATVEVGSGGVTVTSRRAREAGTDLLVALRDAGIAVTGFNVRAPTLDDVFLAITGEHVEVEEEPAVEVVQ